jgi:GWxTD domain-containing protein
MQCLPLTRAAARQIVLFLTFTLIASSFTVFAQEAKSEKTKQTSEPLKRVYERWLDDDVYDIIAEEERKAFRALKTDNEREQFIEQFWLRRDPDPDTEVNEFKEEHYRRVAYANEHFSSGIPGSKTARGRMYIKFGKPDQIESHPAGGSYERPAWEGGGRTSTFPFEIWWYRYIEDVGSDVEIEFVDPTGSGEYRIAKSPDEKDALLHVPGERNSLLLLRAKDNPFDKMAQQVALERPPHVKFSNIDREFADSDNPRLIYDRLPFHLGIDFLRVTENAVITSFTVQMENQDLVYKDIGGIQQAAANIYARITKVSGQRADQFEDVVLSNYTAEQLTDGLKARSVYQRDLVLAPGIYKIDIKVQDTRSGKADIIKRGFTVPRYTEGELSASSLMLASRLEPLNGLKPSRMFNRGLLKVIPNVGVPPAFKPDHPLGVYMQVYNVAIDQTTLRPSLDVEYLISRSGREVARLKEDGKSSWSKLNTQQVTLARLISLRDLKPGSYELTVTIADQVAGKTIKRQERFQITQ